MSYSQYRIGLANYYRNLEIFQKESYYNEEGELVMPRHTRNYYDCFSSQFKSITMETKLSDLGYLVSNGFDLLQSVENYKIDREEYITRVIPQTFLFYILYMRYGEFHHFSELILRKLSEKRIIQLFMDEIKLRYNQHEHKVELLGWDDKKLLLAANGNKNKFQRLIKTARRNIDNQPNK